MLSIEIRIINYACTNEFWRAPALEELAHARVSRNVISLCNAVLTRNPVLTVAQTPAAQPRSPVTITIRSSDISLAGGVLPRSGCGKFIVNCAMTEQVPWGPIGVERWVM